METHSLDTHIKINAPEQILSLIFLFIRPPDEMNCASVVTQRHRQTWLTKKTQTWKSMRINLTTNLIRLSRRLQQKTNITLDKIKTAEEDSLRQNTASSCRRGCGSTTLALQTGCRAGCRRRQPCLAPWFSSQGVVQRHLLASIHIIAARTAFRWRRTQLVLPHAVTGAVMRLVGLQSPASRSSWHRRL